MSQLIFDLNAPFCSLTKIFFPKIGCKVYYSKLMLLNSFEVILHWLVLTSRYIVLAGGIIAEAGHAIVVSSRTHALDFSQVLSVERRLLFLRDQLTSAG